MKSIIKIILISLIIVSILGYAENNLTFGNDTRNLTITIDNNSFFVLNQSLWSKPSYIFNNKNSIERFRIQSTNWNFTNATMIINISYIQNITFDNDKMIIQMGG